MLDQAEIEIALLLLFYLVEVDFVLGVVEGKTVAVYSAFTGCATVVVGHHLHLDRCADFYWFGDVYADGFGCLPLY